MQAKDETHLLNIKGQQSSQHEAVIEYDDLSVHFSEDEAQMHHVSVTLSDAYSLFCPD